MSLLSFAKGNAKISKSDADGKYSSAIMYLAPHKMSGINVCPLATVGCIDSCLFTAGHGQFNNVINARLARTKMFHTDREAFKKKLILEISKHVAKAKKDGKIPCVRLNGTSDIPWERVFPELFVRFNDVVFYDYTKIPLRMQQWCEGKLPKNYHLTFSRSENNEQDCRTILKMGGSVATVFAKKGELPRTYLNRKVFDGDMTDLRFLDPKKHIIGLYAKGRAKKDKTGFVVRGQV